MFIGKNEIRKMLLRANDKVSHILIVCDTFDFNYYAVFVQSSESVKEYIDKYSQNMQEVIEVYKTSVDLESQLEEYRAWHI